MNIKPLFDRIVIEPLETEEKTKSGIVLLAKDQEKPQMARVTAVGPGGQVDGKDVKMVVKVGDKVETGAVLCILEAMKMENEVMAPDAGTVTSVTVAKGASVQSGDVLVTLA